MHLVENWIQCQKAELLNRLNKTAVLETHGLRLVAAEGLMDIVEVEQLLDLLSEFNGVPRKAPTIYDLRCLDFTYVTTETIKSWVILLARHPDLMQTKAVFVVPSELGFGMMRMFQLLSEAKGAAGAGTFQVTYSITEAARWARAFRGVRNHSKDTHGCVGSTGNHTH